MTLGGVFSSSQFSYYKISVLKCVDEPQKNKICKTDKEVEDELKKYDGTMRFQLYQSNNIINPNSRDPVLQYLSDTSQFLFSPGQVYVTANLFYGETTLKINQNIWVGQNIEEQQIPYYSQDELKVQYIPKQSNGYSSFYIRKSMFRDILDREFQKVDALISYIGGFAQSIFFVVSFIIGFFNQKEFQIELANKLYDFEVKKNHEHNHELNNWQQSGNLKDLIRSSGQHSSLTEGQWVREIIKNTASRRRRNAIIYNQQDPIIEQIKNLLINLSPQSESEQPIDIKQSMQSQKENRNQNSDQSTKSQTRAESIDCESTDQKNTPFNLDKQKPAQFSKIKRNLQIICEEDSANQSDIISNNKMQSPLPQKEKQIQQNSQTDFSNQEENIILSLKSITDILQNQNKVQIKQLQTIEQDQDKKGYHKEEDINQVNEKQNAAANKIALFMKKKKQQNEMKNQQNSIENQQLQNGRKLAYNSNQNENKEEFIAGKFNIKSRRSFLINQFQELISRQNKVSIRFKFYLNKLFCGKYFNSDENKLIGKAQEEINKVKDIIYDNYTQNLNQTLINQDLDVFYMIERIKEVDKIKKIIFDKEQQILFNFCPKPILKLNEDQIILTRTQLQSKVRQMSTSQQYSEKQKEQQQSPAKAVFKSQQLLKNTIQAVNYFKKRIQEKNQYIEMNVYKYLYEAYDTILEHDPKLKKRIKYEGKSPLKKGIKQQATPSEINNPQYDKQQENQEQESVENIKIKQQMKIKDMKRKQKRLQTFSECNFQDSIEDIDKEEKNQQGVIAEDEDEENKDEENKDEEKSESIQQNEKQLIYFSSGTLSDYSTDEKDTQKQKEQSDNLFAKKMQQQKQNESLNNIDNAQIFVTEEPFMQTQPSEVSFSQNNANFIQDQNIQTIFSPKQDEDHPFQRNSQQGNIFKMDSAHFQNEED